MKRYLFLKLGLTILVFAAASPRSQVSENYSGSRDSRRISNNNQNSQNVEQTTAFSSQRGDTNTPAPDYQGVMGKPGVDFPVLKFIPRTKFTCRGKKSGYYADLDTNCQVFHICDEGRKVSFLCPNGTIFQQSDLICDWWFKVDCASSPNLYEESAEQLNEENRRRKENRKVQQQQERKAIKPIVNNRQQQNKYQQNNFAKKDVNQYTSNQPNYYDNNEDYSNYKETQIPSESASFVSNRYNQQRYLKSLNLNDVTEQTYLPPKTTYGTSDASTEKIINNNRGARTYNNKFQYRNQVIEQIKTTTQHTIYSPTVPPFTSTSKFTTRAPAAFSTTQQIRSRQKSVPGFYITKDYSTVPTPSNDYSTIAPQYKAEKISTTTTQSINLLNSRPLAGSEIITRNSENTETTTIVNNNPTNAFFEDASTQNTVTPSVPTPFKSSKDISTHKFNEFTYLPKSTEINNKIPTPKPTQPTEYTTYGTNPTVTDNINNMIKTLEEIEGENPLLEARPGLNIPPSAGPKTLHSLAIYFATALDNLVGNETSNDTERTTTDETHVTLLSRMTQDKYNLLFDENQETTTLQPEHHHQSSSGSGDISLRSLVETDSQLNDLDSQQSRGPVSSSTPRIRQLAQVFTQALSAYLDDPDTFKKVLEEIRPTEPPQFLENTETPTSEPIITTEFKSYTKEEDEVLDFSDADKSSTYKPFVDNNIRTTQATTILPSDVFVSKKIPTPNPLALDLNNGLKLSTSSGLLQDLEETSVEDNTESDDYFPFNTGEDEEDAKKKATAQPYGVNVKPTNSTPISIPANPPTDSLQPPYKISLNQKENSTAYIQNDEYLQSAHSQSFVSHNLIKERQGKSLITNEQTTELSPETTTTYTTTPYDFYTTSTISDESTRYYDESTTENYSTTEYSTTEEPTTSRAIPNDHWSTSPEVTKLWESTLYVDPQIINRNLGISTRMVDTDTDITTYRPEFSTQPYRTTTEYDEDIDLRFTSTTTDDPSTTTDFNEYYSTVIDLGIHSLLNTSELEIATSQAQQIFGKLNSTEQDLLIEKMKEAESNSTVRRLILLLVSTCDASLSNNKTVQETRNSILHALLNSNEITTRPELKSRSGKQLNIETTTIAAAAATTTTTTTTTSKPEIVTDLRSKIEMQNKVVDVDVHQDTRALELLRSLYSLAAKWGKK